MVVIFYLNEIIIQNKKKRTKARKDAKKDFIFNSVNSRNVSSSSRLEIEKKIPNDYS